MNNALITIIIPTFNRAHLIGETLDSVLAQTYENWECIVVDDGSCDGTWEVVESYCKDDERIKLFKRDIHSKGAPFCRNMGVEKSKGSYLIFLDSDDLLANYSLQNRVLKFYDYINRDFLVFSTLLFEKEISDTNILWNVVEPNNYLFRFLALEPPWAPQSVIWKASAFKKKLKMDENILSFQDWDLHIRAIINDLKFEYFTDVDSYYRSSSSHISIGSNSTSNSHLDSHKVLFNNLERKIVMYDNSKEIKIALSALFFWLENQFLLKSRKREAFSLALSKFDILRPFYSTLILLYITLYNKRGFYFFYKIFRKIMPDVYFNHFKYTFRNSKYVSIYN